MVRCCVDPGNHMGDGNHVGDPCPTANTGLIIDCVRLPAYDQQTAAACANRG